VTIRIPSRLASASLLFAVALAPPAAADEPPAGAEARDAVRAALNSARDIDGQAAALARLAWPTDGERVAGLSALARYKLVRFDEYAFQALFDALDRVPEPLSTDVVAVILEARRRHRGGVPAAFIPALERAVWFGSVGARRLAIRELARYHYRPAMLPAIDAAIEDPQLVDTVVELLPLFGHAGARYYLQDVLLEGTERQRRLAAVSLARIGGRALETLRDASLSDDRVIRELAVGALLPLTGVNDLTTLYEYVADHPDDDAELIARVRERAIQLEELLDRAMEQESATPDDY
jgi:hypothetical protein